MLCPHIRRAILELELGTKERGGAARSVLFYVLYQYVSGILWRHRSAKQAAINFSIWGKRIYPLGPQLCAKTLPAASIFLGHRPRRHEFGMKCVSVFYRQIVLLGSCFWGLYQRGSRMPVDYKATHSARLVDTNDFVKTSILAASCALVLRTLTTSS